MQKLNLPIFDFKIESRENKPFIFDPFRKKYVMLTPEEWVRQHFVNYLVHDKNYPVSLIVLERQITLNKIKKRIDILVYNPNGITEIIVECKSASVEISQKNFDQISKYNSKLNANYLIVTNGLIHYFFRVDNESKKYIFLKDIPHFDSQ